MWIIVTGGARFDAPWINYNNHILSEYSKRPSWSRLADLRREHQEAADFRNELDDFLRRSNVVDPAIVLKQAYEIGLPAASLAIPNTFVLGYQNWEAYFRADYTTKTLKGVLIRDCRETLNSTLSSMMLP